MRRFSWAPPAHAAAAAAAAGGDVPPAPPPAAAPPGGASPPQQTAERQRAAAAPGDGAPPAPRFYEVERAPGEGGADSFVTGTPVRIFAYPPGSAVAFEPARAPPVRVAVPAVPGAFVLVGALSRGECRQLLSAGRALGFTRDVDYAFGAGGGAGTGGGAGGGGDSSGGVSALDASRAGGAAGAGGGSAARAAAAREAGLPPAAGRPAEGCVWMADASVLGPIWERVRPLLPQRLGGGDLVGINPRWRLYRYTPGAARRAQPGGRCARGAQGAAACCGHRARRDPPAPSPAPSPSLAGRRRLPAPRGRGLACERAGRAGALPV